MCPRTREILPENRFTNINVNYISKLITSERANSVIISPAWRYKGGRGAQPTPLIVALVYAHGDTQSI